MATAKSLQRRIFSSFIGNNSIRSTQPLLHLFRIDLGRRHVSMQLSRTFSGLTNLLFKHRKKACVINSFLCLLLLVLRNEDEVIDGNRKRLKPGNVSPRRPVPAHITKPPYVESFTVPGISSGLQIHDKKARVREYAGTLVKDGDTINIDVTVYLNGYHGDTSATFFCGDVDEKAKNLVTKEPLEKAISICGPGVEYKKIGKTIHDHADKHKYGVVRQFVGHGNNEAGRMVLNQTFTIEPMLTIGSIKPVMWDDNWTVVTEDASLSAQFEHTILITKDGAEILTNC
ncbi:hypothetical protein F2Q69_00008864 [Brassica cretica]|uniref:Peptidase M24 domain-containing protein n=1 Tax=Brassica cretica TaxID=69181 RepID=A0A8S9PLA4_BRACR|nr:hypothetical protein F2Q69_00008864 [Brassica cretica]